MHKSKWHKYLIYLSIGLFVLGRPVYANDLSNNVWASAEYLQAWVKKSPVSAPLITASNKTSSLSIIGQPGTQVLFGAGAKKDAFKFGSFPGLRLTLGAWFPESNDFANGFGVEGSGSILPKKTSSFSASSLDGQYAATNIPFFATETNRENVLVDRHPNLATVKDNFRYWGAEFSGLYQSNAQFSFPVIFSLGLKYLKINENLQLNDAITGLVPNSILNVQDNFSTKNNFLGLLLGIRTEIDIDPFCFNVGASLAAGKNYQKNSIHGQININNNELVQAIGLFAEPSNIGNFKKRQMAFVPEFQAKLQYTLNSCFRAFIGYNIFYINKVIRPGNQIDRAINQSQNPSLGGSTLVGSDRPSVLFNNSNMWIQSARIGIEYNF